MTLTNFRRHRFQNFLAALLLSGVFLFATGLASPPRAAGNVDCALWFSVCIPATFAQWCPHCLIACLEAYYFCLCYYPQ